MMFRGTEKYPDYDGETTKLGRFATARPNPTGPLYYLVANTGYLDKIMDIEADRLQNLKYTEARFPAPRPAPSSASISRGRASRSAILNEKVRETVFTQHHLRPHDHRLRSRRARHAADGYAYSQDVLPTASTGPRTSWW